MQDAIRTIFEQGISAAAVGQLLVAALVLYVLYELRRLLQQLMAYRRVSGSDAIREGDYVQVEGPDPVSNWKIDRIDWSGVWLINTQDSRLRRWEPHEAFLSQARVFHRNGHPDRDPKGRFRQSAGSK